MFVCILTDRCILPEAINPSVKFTSSGQESSENCLLTQINSASIVSSPGAEGAPVCNHMSPNFDS